MEGVYSDLLPQNVFHDFELLMHGLSPCLRCQIVELVFRGWTIRLECYWQVIHFDHNSTILVVQAWYLIDTTVESSSSCSSVLSLFVSLLLHELRSDRSPTLTVRLLHFVFFLLLHLFLALLFDLVFLLLG